MTDGPSLTERLAERLARPVDAATRARARLHLLDWLGCVAGGRTATNEGYVVRYGETAPALRGNMLEMDDVDRAGRLHPGPVVWSALFLSGGPWFMDYGGFLAAAVRGYEAMIAVGRALDDYHYARWHPTATTGVFGAAAAVATRGEGSGGQCVEGYHRVALLTAALGLAGSVAGGLWQTRHEPASFAKQFHVLYAARVGVDAARLALSDAKGPRYILEGEQGLFAATCREPRPDRMFGAPDAWRIHEVSFKPHAACRHAHPAIDAALELRTRGGLEGAGPILVETYPDALTFCDNRQPRTELEAKFSLQHVVALVAVRGAVTLHDFDDAARSDPAVAAARARVLVASDPAIAARYPEHFGARVSCGGERAEVRDALGDPERPMTADQIEAKARALIAHGGLPSREADLAVELALHLPDDAQDTELRQLVDRWMMQ